MASTFRQWRIAPAGGSTSRRAPTTFFWAAEKKARELDMDYAGQGFRPDSPLVVGLLEFKPPIYVYLDRFNQFGWEGRAAGGDN